jgi:hypothetical protein
VSFSVLSVKCLLFSKLDFKSFLSFLSLAQKAQDNKQSDKQ